MAAFNLKEVYSLDQKFSFLSEIVWFKFGVATDPQLDEPSAKIAFEVHRLRTFLAVKVDYARTKSNLSLKATSFANSKSFSPYSRTLLLYHTDKQAHRSADGVERDQRANRVRL